MTRQGCRWCATAGLLALAGCAQIPAEPEATPAPVVRAPAAVKPDPARATAIARQLTLAQRAAEADDLAMAAAHYRVLVLLAPADTTYQRQLAATEQAIRRSVADNLRAAHTAQRTGDSARAKEALLRVLALDPENTEAAHALREIEQQVMARVQGERAARAQRLENPPPAARPPRAARGADPAPGASPELDQHIEMLDDGDQQAALRELRAFVDTHPDDRAARQRIGAAVAARARDAEASGDREHALTLYEQAGALRGQPTAEWAARSKALRRTLSEEQYTEGMRAWRTDLAIAIRHLEASLRFDPQNLKAATRLREAKKAHEKLQRLSPEPAR